MPTVRAESYGQLSALENQRIGQRDDRYFQSLAANEAIRRSLQDQQNQQFQNSVGLVSMLASLRNQRIAQSMQAQRNEEEDQRRLLELGLGARESDQRLQASMFNAERAQSNSDRQFDRMMQQGEFSQNQAKFKAVLDGALKGDNVDETIVAYGLPEHQANFVRSQVKTATQQEKDMLAQKEKAVESVRNAFTARQEAADTIDKLIKDDDKPVDQKAFVALMSKLSKTMPTLGASLGIDTLGLSGGEVRAKVSEWLADEQDTLGKQFAKHAFFDQQTGTFQPQPYSPIFNRSAGGKATAEAEVIDKFGVPGVVPQPKAGDRYEQMVHQLVANGMTYEQALEAVADLVESGK